MTRQRTVLVVCSGNTCRSPLAAVMLAAQLQHDGVPDVSVTSAGTSAWDGAPAAEGSYLVALERGLDLSHHRARVLTTELVRGADLILTMTNAQMHRAIDLGGGGRAHLLTSYADPSGAAADVADPFGADVATYRAVADQLDDLLRAAAQRIAAAW